MLRMPYDPIMIDRRVLLASLLIISIVGVGIFAVLLNSNNYQVPPPSNLPDGEIQIVTSGDLQLWAKAEYTQDFMPVIPPDGPPFYCFITINITNIGENTIDDLGASRVTIYYNSSFEALVTLNLTTAYNYFAPLSVRPGESIAVAFINYDSFYPTIDEGTVLYSRVLFHWSGGESILTTAPSALLYTH